MYFSTSMDQPDLFRTFRLPDPPSSVTVRKPMTSQEFERAKTHYHRQGGCYHVPQHEDWKVCVRMIALAFRGYR